MRFVIISVFFSWSCLVFGQFNPYEFCDISSFINPEDSRIVTYTEIEYSLSKNGENEKFDTILMEGGLELKFQKSMTYMYSKISENERRLTTFLPDGNKSTEILKFDKKGRIMERNVEPAKADAIALSSYKRYRYDENGRILKVLEKKCSNCDTISFIQFSYDKNNLIQKIESKIKDFGLITSQYKLVDDKYVYDFNFNFTKQFEAVLAKSKSTLKPEMKIECIWNKNINNLTLVTWTNQNRGKILKKTKKEIRDMNFRLTLLENYDEEGIVTSQLVQSYHKNGKVQSIANQATRKPLINTFNKDGKYLLLHDFNGHTVFEYDKHGNWIEKRQFVGNKLMKLSTRSIKY